MSKALRIAAWALIVLQASVWAVLALLMLTGCGGGSEDDDKVPPPGVDCAARPELCT